MNSLTTNGPYVNPGAPKPAPQPAGDPNWPAWFYHPDGRSKLCRTERESTEQCAGWSPTPLPPPPMPAGPVPPEKVQEIVAAAVKTALDAAQAKFEDGKEKFKQKYKELDEAFKALQTRNDILAKQHAELTKEHEALQKVSLSSDKPAPVEEEQGNIFAVAAAARAVGPEEKY